MGERRRRQRRNSSMTASMQGPRQDSSFGEGVEAEVGVVLAISDMILLMLLDCFY